MDILNVSKTARYCEHRNMLINASVLVIGAGGLGAPLLLGLASAGIGRIDIVDGDIVSLSDLNRQIIYSTSDIGYPKAPIAARKLAGLFNEVLFVPHLLTLTDENVCKLVSNCDAAAFCVDNYHARRIANRACVGAKIPFADAGVDANLGMFTCVVPGVTACRECFSSGDRPAKPTSVLGAVAGMAGFMQAAAVVGLLSGNTPNLGELVIINFDSYEQECIPLTRDKNCPVCSNSFADNTRL